MINEDAARRRRALRRAAGAWQNGKPHRAWEILAAAGYEDLWPKFQRQALGHARRTFVVRMTTA